MFKALDSHMTDYSSSPRSDGLKLMPGLCACAQHPRRRIKEKGITVNYIHSPNVSLSLSLSLSLCEHIRPMAKTLEKNTACCGAENCVSDRSVWERLSAFPSLMCAELPVKLLWALIAGGVKTDWTRPRWDTVQATAALDEGLENTAHEPHLTLEFFAICETQVGKRNEISKFFYIISNSYKNEEGVDL